MDSNENRWIVEQSLPETCRNCECKMELISEPTIIARFCPECGTLAFAWEGFIRFRVPKSAPLEAATE